MPVEVTRIAQESRSADRSRGDRQVLMLNPYHRYGSLYIEAYQRMGIRTVCWFTDPVQLKRQTFHFPDLMSDAVADRYLVAPGEEAAFAVYLREHHNIVGVIPIVESGVVPSDEMARLLDLDWAQGETRLRFRDKAALKEHLRGVERGPRINVSAIVSSLADVEAVLSTHDFARFVIKPNDGYGNSGIGFFDADNVDPVREFLGRPGLHSMLLEEFIDGDEYFVNGQIDGAGRVTVYRIGEYDRRPFNGKPNVDFGARVVRTHEPHFNELVEYAVHVMQASGLRRSPFHLEAKVDDSGPCLIEVGARLCGAGGPVVDGQSHGSFDAFDVSAHYFVSSEDIPLPLDWVHYDAMSRGSVMGVDDVDERIFELCGVAEVEAMPEFSAWWVKPAVGQHLERTLDVLSPPYLLNLEARDDESLEAARVRVLRTLGWNSRSHGAVRRARQVAAAGPVLGRRVHEWVFRPKVTQWK